MVAPFSLRGLACAERRRRLGLGGAANNAIGLTSAGDNAVLEGLRDEVAGLLLDIGLGLVNF